jgi:acetyl-CoA C-acetyltransferase
MQSRAYVIGYGQVKCGFYPKRDMRSLLSEAFVKAIEHSKIEPKQIQQMWLSHYPVACDLQATAGQVAIEAVGLGTRIGCITIEQACCSGGQVIHDATLAIDSGRYDCIMIAAFAKIGDSMRPSERSSMDTPLWRIGPFEESGFNPFFMHAGILLTAPGEFQDYLRKYKVGVEDIASWNATEFFYATKHPNSLCYGERPWTKEEFMAIGGGAAGTTGCDGASVIILGSKDFAKQYTDKLVRITGVSHKLESSYYPKQYDYDYGGGLLEKARDGTIIHSQSVENTWKEVLEQAEIKPIDLDFLNPHDCTAVVAYTHIDGLHHPLIPEGKAPKWFSEGEAYPNGKFPICTQGSAKFGQPRGATCLNFLIECTQQLREEAGSWQVPIKNGLAAGGTSPGRPMYFVVKREK